VLVGSSRAKVDEAESFSQMPIAMSVPEEVRIHVEAFSTTRRLPAGTTGPLTILLISLGARLAETLVRKGCSAPLSTSRVSAAR